MSTHDPHSEPLRPLRMLLAHLLGMAVAALLILGLTLLACLLLPAIFR